MALLINEFINIAKANKNQPMLRSIAYNAQAQTIAVTDRHRALIASAPAAGDGEVTANVTIDIDTMQQREGNYPDINRIVPTGNAGKITITGNNWKMLKGYDNPAEVPSIHTDENMNLIAAGVMIGTSQIEIGRTFLNAKYLYEMLNFMYKVDKFKGEWEITWHDALSAFMVSNQVYKYILTPVRTY